MKKYIVKGDFHPTSATGGTAGTSLAISAGATTVTLIPSTYVIDYSKVGNESTTVSFTTVPFNMQGTVFYEFLVGATSKQNLSFNFDTPLVNTANQTFTLADSDEPGPTDAPIKVTVKVRQGTNDGTLIAQDTVSIYSVQDGQSTVTGLLTNEAHTVATNNDGTGASFTGAGGTFKVFYGNTDITTNAKTVFSVSSETGVDVSINSSTGVYTVSSMSADTGTAIFSCEVEGSLIDGVDNQNDVTITKTYTIARAKTGAEGASVTGAAGQANAIVYAYQRSASALTSNPGAVTVSLTGTTSGTITTGSLANGWSKTIPTGTDPLYVCAATAAGNGSTDTIAANEWSTAVVLAQGQDGVDGTNNSTIFLYKQNNNSSAPTGVGSNNGLPEGNTTVTFSDGSVSFTTANGWSTTNPGVSSSNQYLWVTQATAIGAAGAATDIIPQSEWAAIKLFASFGTVGDPGTKTALVYAYKRSASDLSGINISSAGPGGVTVSLVSGLITTSSLANSWSKTPVASDGNPLYICAASAAGTGNTDTIAASEWSAPVKFVEDGDDGAAGDSVVLLAIYKTVSSFLALPTISGTSNYNFDTSTLSSIPTGWTTTRPSASGNAINLSYVSEVALSGKGTTNTVNWPTPTFYSPYFDLNPNIFIRSANQPTTPSTGASNPPSGWSSTIPSSGTDPVWQSTGTWNYNASGSTYSWSAAEKITGETGSAGINSATIILYKLTTSSSAPAHPNTTLTWNFANKAFTDSSSELDGWSVNAVPAASDSNYIWSCSATAAANTATDDIPESEWSDPGLIRSPKSQRSAKGFIYYDASTNNAQSAPTTSGVSYNFTTSLLSGLASGWSNSKGTFPYTILDFKVTEATHGGTQTITFGVPELFGDIIDKRRDDFELNWDDANNRLQFKIGGTVFDNASYPTIIRNDQVTLGGLGGITSASLPTATTGTGTPTAAANNGSTFYSTDQAKLYIRVGSTWTESANKITNTNQLTNGAGFTSFDGAYGSLSGTPTLFDGAYGSLSGLPTLFDGAYGSLSGTPTIPGSLSALDSTANTKLSGIATGATNNGSSINSSGNIAGDISMGSKMTFDVSADHILITD